MLATWSLLSLTAVAATLGARTDNGTELTRYTQCGADRGYTEADSLLAAKYLVDNVILSDRHPLTASECVHAHVNTTVVQVCNTGARNRTVNRAEVRRGISQLIKDCGVEGGFTGMHFVNNLTFRAWGLAGLAFGPHGPQPVTLHRSLLTADDADNRQQQQGPKLAKRDCTWNYDGVPHTECEKINKIDPATGHCVGEFRPENQCQVFCETVRTGLFAAERRLPGPAGTQIPADQVGEITITTEFTVEHSFQISVEGIAKEVIGLGVGYAWSIAETKGTAVTKKAPDNTTFHRPSRWVYLPRMIQSCGQIARQSVVGGGSCNGDGCTPDFPTCDGEVEYFDNICSIVPKRDDTGQPEVVHLLRYEYGDGTPLPWAEQTDMYKGVCTAEDIDRDPEKECYNHIQARF